MSEKERKEKRKRTGKKKINLKIWLRIGVAVILCAVIAGGILFFLWNKNTDQADQELTNAEKIQNGTEEPQTMEIQEKANASYERWLAAGMVTGISMQYSDFEINGIYLTGETELSEKNASNGAYVIFTAGDTQIAVHSVPLDAERTEQGTMDLYTRDLGFATFDIVDVESVDTANYKEIDMNELNELISQSLLVSIYEH